MGIFDGIAEVKASTGSLYIKPGLYVSIIDRIKQDKNRKDQEFVALETTVLKVLRNETDESSGVVEQLSNTEGSSPSYLMTNGGNGKDMFLPNVKRLAMEVVGCSEKEVDAQACADMVSEAQPMAGLVVVLEGIQIVTKGGNPYTQVFIKEVMEREDFEKLGVTAPKHARFADALRG